MENDISFAVHALCTEILTGDIPVEYYRRAAEELFPEHGREFSEEVVERLREELHRVGLMWISMEGDG